MTGCFCSETHLKCWLWNLLKIPPTCLFRCFYLYCYVGGFFFLLIPPVHASPLSRSPCMITGFASAFCFFPTKFFAFLPHFFFFVCRRLLFDYSWGLSDQSSWLALSFSISYSDLGRIKEHETVAILFKRTGVGVGMIYLHLIISWSFNVM